MGFPVLAGSEKLQCGMVLEIQHNLSVLASSDELHCDMVYCFEPILLSVQCRNGSGELLARVDVNCQ